MLYFGLAAFTSYGLAYFICSTGLHYWRSAVGILSGFIVGFFGSTALVALIATKLGGSLAMQALGQVAILSLLLSFYGAYRARFQLKTGKPALPFKIPNWVSYVAGAVFLIGIVAAIAIPASQNTAKFDSSTAKPWDKYSSNDKQPQEEQWGENDKPAPTLTTKESVDWSQFEPVKPAQPQLTPQNGQIDTFLNQQPKANTFDQFDEKSSQTLAPEHLTKRKIILEKIRLKEVLEINGVTTAGMPQNAISWSTSNTLDLERNQTSFRYDKTRFNTHIVNNSSNNLSVIGFDFKESNCSDNTKSNRFFVNLERPISPGSAAVVNFIMPESLVSKGGNFCLDIVSAWN